MGRIMTDSIKVLQTILYNFKLSKGSIRAHAFITGPSGSGKTYNTEYLCRELGLQFVSINAASLTKEGISGNSLAKAMVPLKANQDQPIVCLVDE